MLRYVVPLAIFAVIGLFFLRGLWLNPSYVPSPLVGKPVPTFSLPDVEDTSATVSSADLLGRVALVNVWGTWCVECRHEHGFLVELARAGVPIFGLNVRDDRVAAGKWLARLGDPYVSSGFDPEGKVAIDWGVTGAPETFLIGSDGTILHKHISPLTPFVWQRDFVPLLREHCGPSDCAFLAAVGAR
ncbi:MAG TPA: DsbE family thiol:disulfide interchange protein [Gammaproteobacteria bacterium]|nr:DsbE family thiol:disulfide interchange protein [Gammaproteobacteria bacterium]